jgi:hypothetical protein
MPKKTATSNGTVKNRVENYFEPDTFHTKPSGRRTKPEVPDAMKKGRTKDVPPEPDEEFTIEEVRMEVEPARFAEIRIAGTCPLMFNRPNPETIEKIKRKQEGEGRAKAPPRDPTREFLLAAHLISGEYSVDALPDNTYGIPGIALKKAILNASFRQGDEKNRKDNMGSFFVNGPYEGLVPLKATPPEMRTDVVKLRNGDLTPCYRPIFWPWECVFVVEYWHSLVTLKELTKWVQLAGQHGGIGSRRIENSGEKFGGFDLVSYRRLPAGFVPPYYKRTAPTPLPLPQGRREEKSTEEKPKKAKKAKKAKA